MRKLLKSIKIFFLFVLSMGYLTACVDFFNPDQGIDITEEQLYSDWYEYRSAAMGMYSLQQDLVEQLVVLGELRGDLLTVTENADPDLMEIYNFNISRNNKYASPQNFFKLIAATNRIISILEHKQPHVTDKDATINNYDRLYGEALTMRAWAYFNAVRIYGKVPFIDQRFSSIEAINEFLDSPTTYEDSIYVIYGLDGYNNDTIFNQQVELEKNFFDIDRTIRYFTNDLETKVKAVGVNHYIDNDDNSWEVTIWSEWGYKTLLGHMYLTIGDLANSAKYFEEILKNNSEDNRYQLTDAFEEEKWIDIFMNIDRREHIFTLEFNKQNQQQHGLQRLFEPFGASEYMLKPTAASVHHWETQWRNYSYRIETNPTDSTRTINPGIPSDFYRGFGVSYIYVNQSMEVPDYFRMLEHKRLEEPRTVENIMQGVDTIVYKYSIGKSLGGFDLDANYIIYRAGGVNLYVAEIYNYWRFVDQSTNTPRTYYQNALNIVNNGSYYDPQTNRIQLGVRGRVGLPGFTIQDNVHVFDPFTNEYVRFYNLQNNLRGKQHKLENEIMEERARELAYEGERFYDLMRVSKRRGDPTYLAERVSAKYPEGMRENIYNLLLNEENWYINYFE